MDPAFAYDNNTNAVVDQITEGLLAFDQKNQLTPCLAESWKQTDDLIAEVANNTVGDAMIHIDHSQRFGNEYTKSIILIRHPERSVIG